LQRSLNNKVRKERAKQTEIAEIVLDNKILPTNNKFQIHVI